MLVFEAKLEGEKQQYERLDEAIRTARFIRNSCIRYWMDSKEIGRYELSQRTHRCPRCGHIQDRDWNAAINILELGLRTVGHTGTLNASGDIDLCLGEETPLSKSSRGKRRPKK